MQIKEKVKKFLGEYVNIKEVKDTDNIFETGLVNSLFAMNLVTFVEREFEVAIENSDLDMKNFKDINSITEFVERKLA